MFANQRRILRSSQPSDKNEESTDLWYLVRFMSDKMFGIIRERDIEVIDLATRNVLVKEMSKKHPAKFLSFGTRKKCEDDALQFELEISVVSDDDERQISDLNIQLTQSSHCLRVSSQTNISPVPTSSNDFLNKSNQNNYENGDQISQISDQIKNLNEKIENLDRIGRIPSVMFNGFNLVSLSAKDSTKYALRVAAHIFSKDELSNNGILDHCRISTRNQLDPVRVDLIKESVMVKYGISIDKLETIWPSIRNAINSKGRGLQRKFKENASSSPRMIRKNN